MKSPWYGLELRFPWTPAGMVAAVLLAVIHLAGVLTARLRGQIDADCNGNFELIRVTPRKIFDSRRESVLSDSDVQFTLKAQRTLWFIKRIRVSVVKGTAMLDHQQIVGGQSRALRPGRHELNTAISSFKINVFVI